MELNKLFKVLRLAKGKLHDQRLAAYIVDQTQILVCRISVQDLTGFY